MRAMLLIALLSFFAGGAFAQTAEISTEGVSSIEKATEQTSTEDTDTSVKPVAEKVDEWAESIHENISHSVYQSAMWFDGFFSREGNEQKPPQASARIRLGWVPSQADLFELESRFRLSVVLPNLQDRVAFILTDDDDDQLENLPLESNDNIHDFNSDKLTAAIRFTNVRKDDRLTDTRVGISSGDVFVRLRHRQRYSWQEKHGFKFEPAVYYFLNEGIGTRLLLEYNYQVSNNDQLRLNYSIRASQIIERNDWKTGIYYLKHLGDKRASVLGFVSQEYFDEDLTQRYINEHKFSYRYRFNAYKEWLFFEVEPFIEWIVDEQVDSNPGIALRIEGYFEKR